MLNPAGNLAAEIESSSKREEGVVLLVPEEVRVGSISKTQNDAAARQRRPQADSNGFSISSSHSGEIETVNKNVNWRRILLLIVAITIHNIPGNVF